MALRPKKTSWGEVADWYRGHLSDKNTYHEKVISPNMLRLLALKSGEKVLDVACGEGYFSRLLLKNGAKVVGADIAQELIEKAKQQSPEISFFTAPAEKMEFAGALSFDKAVCVLALQNIEHLDEALKEVSRVLKTGGKFVFVLNHPCFRIPRRSEWGYDEKKKIQFRRLDGYLREERIKIDMHPGETATGKKSVATYSFHRPLQVYVKALSKNGFVVTQMEEWVSHRKSEKGPKSEAEDGARKEFPLFLAVSAQKLR